MLGKWACFLFFLMLTRSFLLAEDLNNVYQATLESEPSAVIEGCVNAVTGNFYLDDIDVTALGKESVYFKKNYINILSKVLNTAENRNSITPYELRRLDYSGWEHFSHIVAYVDYDSRDEKKYRRLDIYEPSGVFVSYDIRDPDKKKNEPKDEYKKRKNKPRKLNFHNSGNGCSRSYVNTSKGMISARTNYKNNTVEKIGNNDLKVFHVDGSIKFYNRKNLKNDDDPYFLEYEILPNGNKIKYEYDCGKKQLVKIRALSPGGKEYSRINIDTIREDIKLDKKKKNYRIKTFIHTNTGKHAEYFYEGCKSDYDYGGLTLKSIKSTYGEDNIEYYPHFTFFLTKYVFPKNRPFCVDYYLEGCKNKKGYKKVSRLRAPLGKNKDQGLYTAYSFDYETSNETKVLDAYNNETRYLYEKETLRLKEIQRHERGKASPVSREKLVWGKDAQDGFLLAKIFYNSENRPVKAILNQYDAENKGNIIKKTIYGDISKNGNVINLDSNGMPIDFAEKQVTQYFYFSNNLLSGEKDQNGLSVKYTYHVCQIDNQPFQTDLPLTKFVVFNNEIKQRTFYEYDSDNVLIREITDDGSGYNINDLTKATRRLIKKITPRNREPYGLTDTLEECYLDFETGKEKLLRKTKYEYSKACKVTELHIYGSDNQLKYTLRFTYDEKDNLIEQTDPLGRTAKYKYDESGNKIYELTFEEKELFYNYDACSRLISKTIKNENESLIETYEYDLKHNKTTRRDIRGNETHYEYNAFNGVIKEILPFTEDENGKVLNPVWEYAYDGLGNQILKKDPKGNITKTSYNIFGKPLKIIYPDNTQEIFIYNLNGTLLEHMNQEGTKTRYEYDYLKRMISKKTVPLKGEPREEKFEYGGFDLLQKTDPDGNITKYIYDGAGRKIKEEFFSKNGALLSAKEIFYDELGFIKKKIKGNSLVINYKRDFLGRVLEKTKENLEGKLLFKKGFEYDKSGRKKTIISYMADKKSLEVQYFDALDRLVKSADAFNNETIIKYTIADKALIKETANPIGQKTIIAYDAFNREKKVEKKNPSGRTVAKEEKFYDLNGNLSRQVSVIYNLSDFTARQVTTLWQYDEMNKVIKLTEALNTKDEKITRYGYTALGLLEKTITPNNVEIINQYDGFRNKIGMYSSSGDINYVFMYNSLDQLTEAKDVTAGLTAQRVYDAKNNLLYENLSNGLKITNEYDLLNNRIGCAFFDGGKAEYAYDPLNLKQVMRKDKDGRELYRHEFLEYGLSGNLLKEKLIKNAGYIDYKIDLLGQITSIKTFCHAQNIVYDEIGRISSVTWSGCLDDRPEYKYDDLNQVIQETGLFDNSYLFDSNYNRLKKNEDVYRINDLNRILANTENDFIYDKNGNPVEKITKDGKIYYSYDSLDRLIRIEKPGSYILEFTYDPFNRRMSKKYLKYSHQNGWSEEDFSYFLYDGQNEIGSFDKYLNQKELRILADSEEAEISSAIAFEIQDKVYAPVYDISGNVVSLILNDSLQEHYRYSAFGEKKIFAKDKDGNLSGYQASRISNPWGFSSKRIDEESGLVYYGRRYYAPELGRWLTPDPAGFEDGLNLYAFVLNDPLIRHDLYGLYANPWMFYGLNYQDDVWKGALSGAWNFGTRALTGLAGSNDDSIYWNIDKELQSHYQREISRDYINNLSRDWFASKIQADVNNPVFKSCEKWTERGLNTAALYYSAKSAFSLIKPDFSRQTQVFKQFGAQPQADLLSGRSLYSGIDVEQLIKNVKNSLKNRGIYISDAKYSFTKHALERIEQRKITHGDIEDTLLKPLKINDIIFDKYNRPSQRIIGRYSEIVINPTTNEIITLNPTSTKKARKLINNLDKKL